jgi:hypothetical protein
VENFQAGIWPHFRLALTGWQELFGLPRGVATQMPPQIQVFSNSEASGILFPIRPHPLSFCILLTPKAAKTFPCRKA